MNISISMIEERLPFSIERTNYPGNENTLLNLSQCVPYDGGDVLKCGVLYLISPGLEKGTKLKAEPGACAIIIGPPPKWFPARTAYISLPLDTDLVKLWGVVSQVFFEYNEVERKLGDAVQTGQSLQVLVDIISQAFKNEIYVRSNTMRILAKSNKIITYYKNAGQEQPDAFGNLSIDVLDHVRTLLADKEMSEMREPFLYVNEMYPDRSIAINIFYMDGVVGRILVAEVNCPFRPYDLELLRFFSKYVVRCFEQGVFRDTMVSINHLQLIIKSCLNRKTVDKQKLREALLLNQWQDSENFLCILAAPNQAVGVGQPLYFSRLLSMEFPEICSLPWENKVVCVVNLDMTGGKEAFINRFKYFLRDNALIAGFSNVFSDLLHLYSYHCQASYAIEIGMEKNHTFWLHNFSDYAMDYVAAKAAADMDIEHLCAYEIKLLKEYDRENGSQYCETLQAYLENQLNTSQTAKALHVHRETMIYRIKRIKALTGIKFNDNDQLMYLAFSFRIMESNV